MQSINNKKAYNEIFNVGADKPYTINQLLEIVCKIFNKSPNISNQPPRNEVVHAFSSHDKIKNHLSFQSQYSLKEGVKIMAEWANKVGAKETTIFENIEIKNNLPPIWTSK